MIHLSHQSYQIQKMPNTVLFTVFLFHTFQVQPKPKPTNLTYECPIVISSLLFGAKIQMNETNMAIFILYSGTKVAL